MGNNGSCQHEGTTKIAGGFGILIGDSNRRFKCVVFTPIRCCQEAEAIP